VHSTWVGADADSWVSTTGRGRVGPRDPRRRRPGRAAVDQRERSIDHRLELGDRVTALRDPAWARSAVGSRAQPPRDRLELHRRGSRLGRAVRPGRQGTDTHRPDRSRHARPPTSTTAWPSPPPATSSRSSTSQVPAVGPARTSTSSSTATRAATCPSPPTPSASTATRRTGTAHPGRRRSRRPRTATLTHRYRRRRRRHQAGPYRERCGSQLPPSQVVSTTSTPSRSHGSSGPSPWMTETFPVVSSTTARTFFGSVTPASRSFERRSCRVSCSR
jgi:hypothetical protein